MSDEPTLEDLDVAVAHWHINSWGGAEYLVTHLADAVGVNRVYTMGAPDPDDPNPYGDVEFVDVTPSLDYTIVRRLQQRAGRIFEYAMWEDVDWREFGDPDVLITSGATTRAVITPDDTLHVNYCHSPPRWFYDLYHDRKGSLPGMLARPLVRYLRLRDQTVDPRVDQYLANSPIIERRLWKYYKRDSEVMYPPVDLSKYRDEGDGGYYLHLGRVDEEKGISAIVESFNNLDSRLVLVGSMGDVDGWVQERIDSAGNIDYRGFVPESEKLDMLARCRAVVFNGRNEDFGIVPVEANASGKAVLARAEGFPGLFVHDGDNGLLHDGSAGGIRAAVERLERNDFGGNPRGRVSTFSLDSFRGAIRSTVSNSYGDFSLQ